VYDVVTRPSALRDIADHYRSLEEHAYSPVYPERWFDTIEQAIGGLADYPFACALAPEDTEFEEEIRHRIVGSYRILFTVDAGRVHVLHVGHARQDVLDPDR
jgi:plasmid stabilization system protein ParE